MQKRNFLFLVLLFVFIGGRPAFAQIQEPPVEELNAKDQNTWDFGKVKEGEIFKHNFVLKNNSKFPMRIKEVYTSCGCTTAHVREKVNAPGKEALVEAAFNSKGYSGPAEQYVYVRIYKRTEEVIKFEIEADVLINRK